VGSKNAVAKETAKSSRITHRKAPLLLAPIAANLLAHSCGRRPMLWSSLKEERCAGKVERRGRDQCVAGDGGFDGSLGSLVESENVADMLL
jgi:hypothetical protein